VAISGSTASAFILEEEKGSGHIEKKKKIMSKKNIYKPYPLPLWLKGTHNTKGQKK